MTLAKGFVGGVLAAAATSFAAAAARGLGLPLNLELVLGSALTEQTGVVTWVLGFSVYLLFGGLAGFLYGIAAWIVRRTGALAGALLGLGHLVVDGVGIGWLGEAHPLMPALMAAPGPFYADAGAETALAFALLHVLYGALVGHVLAPARPPAPAPEVPESAPALAPTDAHA